MTDVNDFDLEDLMAELEAQNADIAAKEEQTKSATPTPTPVAPAPSPVIDVDANAELEEFLNDNTAALQPTAADQMTAEQEVDLEEVFGSPVIVKVPDVEPEIEIQPQAPISSELQQAPNSELQQAPALEPQMPTEVELAVMPEALPDLDDKLVMSPKAAAEKAKLLYAPNINDFQSKAKVTDATLDRCMNDQASLMAYQATEYARAEHQVAKAKLDFEVLEAGLYDRYRTIAIEAGEKVTEKSIENSVRRDVKWKQAKLLIIEAQAYADIHKGFVSSLRDRRDMLIQRGADRREEMKGQVRTVGSSFGGYQSSHVEYESEQLADIDTSNMTLAQKIALKGKQTLNRI